VQLIDDPGARDEMGQAGLQRLTTTLSWELQVPRLLAAYERAMENRGRLSTRRRMRTVASLRGPRGERS
jgi:hypothetical protein